MALFDKSSNPTLKESIFEKTSQDAAYSGVMTVGGTVTKTFLLLGMTVLAGAYTWKMVYGAIDQASVMPWMWGGLIAGFVLALIISFAPKTAPYLSLFYAVAEGFFLGAISGLFETMFADKFPGIVITAVGITMLTMFVMLFLYQARIIRVTEKFRSVIIIATVSVFAFYLISIALRLFGVDVGPLHGSSLLSIGISIVIVVIAALNLLLDFDFIEKGAEARAPKYLEWYAAFGLMVTLIWLYLEILKLLAKISSRN